MRPAHPPEKTLRFILRRRRSHSRRDRLIESHLWLVGPIARGIHAALPSSFDLLDLVSAGTLGLIEAAQHRNCSGARDRKAMFASYARHRIRGAILDSIRRNRSTEPHHEPLETLRQLADPNGARQIEASVAGREIWDAFRTLPAPEARMIYSRYWQGLTIAEVAAEMGMTPVAAYRLHRRALEQMRACLGRIGVAA